MYVQVYTFGRVPMSSAVKLNAFLRSRMGVLCTMLSHINIYIHTYMYIYTHCRRVNTLLVSSRLLHIKLLPATTGSDRASLPEMFVFLFCCGQFCMIAFTFGIANNNNKQVKLHRNDSQTSKDITIKCALSTYV